MFAKVLGRIRVIYSVALGDCSIQRHLIVIFIVLFTYHGIIPSDNW